MSILYSISFYLLFNTVFLHTFFLYSIKSKVLRRYVQESDRTIPAEITVHRPLPATMTDQSTWTAITDIDQTITSGILPTIHILHIGISIRVLDLQVNLQVTYQLSK